MFKITISGETTEQLVKNGLSILSLLGGTSAKTLSVLSDSDQARLRGDAVVVPPSGDKTPTAAEKKAAEKAAAKAAAEAAAAAAEADALGETESEEAGDEAEALTHDDVKKLLIEVRGAYPKDATIISTIVKEHGKAAKISDVEAKLLPAVADHCRKLLAKAKK
jgi:hypothetical protein